MDHMAMYSIDDENAPARFFMVNHGGGGMFSYALPGNGIQGDKHWIAKGIAKDIDNRATKDARAQVGSDQGQSIVALQEEVRKVRRGKTICTHTATPESPSATAVRGTQ